MGFHSLPLERVNTKISDEYCYLAICKYKEDYLKSTKENKLSAKELKERKEALERQKKTIQQLDTGYCNLHNNKIEMETIFGSFLVSNLENDNYIFYKIKPLTCRENRNSYYSHKKFEVSEFEVLKKFNNNEEIIKQLYEDRLLREFASFVFDNLCYSNEGYNLKLYKYFEYFKETFPGYDISLQDIVLTNDYNHAVKNKFDSRNTSELAKVNIRYLLKNGLVKYFKEDDYYRAELIIGLINCGLFDVALHCVRLLEDWHIQDLLKNKNFEKALRKWSTDNDVKEIIKTLNIKLSGITLTVKNDDYDEIVETKTFENIGEAKTYLIKNYDISFEEVMNKDIEDLEIYPEDSDSRYKFEIS